MQECLYRMLRAPEFEEWLDEQSDRTKTQIYKRLANIEIHGHFGDHHSVSDYETGVLKDSVWELRWSDGKRVYYAYIPEKRILLILGGNKNGQTKDISKAKNIYLKTTKISPKTKWIYRRIAGWRQNHWIQPQ